MEWLLGEYYEGFQLIKEEKIEEIEGSGYVFVHKKSGVRVLALSNKDVNKVFSLSFQTIPQDQTGVAHIVEHAVCCSSKNYPLKETFVALGQGSIATAMNACTYPDMTMYYAASPHEKDLMGIAKVYMDLVFHPSIYENSSLFWQEGWHYELEHLEEELSYNGIVYNEMEGEYGEPETRLMLYQLEALFPDTCYRYDSGGEPNSIPTLSEADFLAFHKKYYIGSNCILTLYGDGNLKEQLKYLNENGLEEVEKGVYTEKIEGQKPFSEPKYTMGYYPATEDEKQTLLSLSFVIGEGIDPKLRLTFELLEHMLLRSTASPLLEKLVVKEHLGMSLCDGGYDACRKQPLFSITLKGSSKEKALRFEEAVFETLQELSSKGIDQKLMEAAFETLAFELIETDATYEPIGIAYSEMMLSSTFHGGEPFAHITYKKPLEEIKLESSSGYFEAIIKKYLLDNEHRVLTILMPNTYLREELQREQQKKLSEYKAQLTKVQLKKLIKRNDFLREEQVRENTPQELEILPKLALSDMPPSLPKLKLIQGSLSGRPVQFHLDATKGICYFHFLFKADAFEKEDLPYLGVFAHLFSYVGTKKHHYMAMENAINHYCGGLSCGIHAYSATGEDYIPYFKVTAKVLHEHLEKFLEILLELFTETNFGDKDKLKEILGHTVYEMERSFIGAGEYRATQRLYTYFEAAARYEDQVSGVAFYHFCKKLYKNFDERYPVLAEKLQQILKTLINKETLKLAVTLNPQLEKETIRHLERFIEKLPSFTPSFIKTRLEPGVKNEGFYVGQQVQAIAKGFNFKQAGFNYHGSLEVACNILENSYLWDRVRLQGGAYGCDVTLGREGYLAICSYSDPELVQTLQTFERIGDYLAQLTLEHSVLERTVVSTLGALLSPCSMEQQSERACLYFVTGKTQEMRQQTYDEIRQTTNEDLRKCSMLFKAMNEANYHCAIGNKNILTKAKRYFSVIDSIL